MEQTLRLLVADPDLASAIQSPPRRRAALRAVTAGEMTLAPGEQPDRRRVESEGTLGFVVLSGFLVREWSTGNHVSADLLGPEDVAHPWGGEPMITMLRHTVSWTALAPTRLALLDRDFFERSARWPEIAGALLERAGRLGQRLSLRGAIETFSVDARLLTSFWLWASQWGTVAGNGVVLRVPLSHERIARLIHARRPTVTSALGRLRNSGWITQRQDGAWLLKDPVHDGDPDADEHGIAMPVIGEMLDRRLGVRATNLSLASEAEGASYKRELETMNEELRIRTTELTNANLLVDSMLESLGVAVVVLDRELRIKNWNEQAKQLWGLDARDVRDQNFLSLDIGLPLQELHDTLRASMAGRQASGEHRLQARDRTGRDIVCRVLCSPLHAARGEISGVIVRMQAVES